MTPETWNMCCTMMGAHDDKTRGALAATLRYYAAAANLERRPTFSTAVDAAKLRAVARSIVPDTRADSYRQSLLYQIADRMASGGYSVKAPAPLGLFER